MRTKFWSGKPERYLLCDTVLKGTITYYALRHSDIYTNVYKGLEINLIVKGAVCLADIHTCATEFLMSHRKDFGEMGESETRSS